MLESLFYFILVLGLLFLILAIVLRGDKEYWWMVCLGLSIICFLALAPGVMTIEIPYYTTVSNEVNYNVHGTDYSLSFLFLGIAIIEIVYMLYYIFIEVGFLVESLFKRKYTR